MNIEALCAFLRRHETVTGLTGAGCSTGSGIPAYRDENGDWLHRKPVQFADFVAERRMRQRYWAGSFAGWTRICGARPNRAHAALATLEKHGKLRGLITQNVDELHRVAGSRAVVDLHGVLSRIRCLGCGRTSGRGEFQERLAAENPDWNASAMQLAPDGDARLEQADFALFEVPACLYCGGIVKPDVVFFGEAVPADRVERAADFLRRSDALLVVGSSLMVFSGFRFARMADALGKPIAIVNLGKTRADSLAICKMSADCGSLLAAAVASVTEEAGSNARSVDRSI